VIDNSENEGGGESDQWYLGSVPTFGPNTAYSLYGVLNEDRRDRGCAKASYINSFETTEGLKSFTDALNMAGVSNVYVASTNNGDDDDDNVYNQYNEYNFANSDGSIVSTDCAASGSSSSSSSSSSYSYSYSSTSRSKGIACQSDSYVWAEFFGAYCEGDIYTVSDTLSSFNKDMKNTGCVEIYDSSTYTALWASDDDQEEEEEQSHSSDDEGDAINGPLYLLQSSKACSYRDSSCPDPYGKLKKYTFALERATGSLNAAFAEEEEIMRKSEAMTTAGIVLLLVATCLVAYEVFQEFSGVRKSPRRSGKGGLRQRVRKLVSKKGSKKGSKNKAPEEDAVSPMPTISVTKKHPKDAASIASVGSLGGVSVGSKKATWYPISLPDVPTTETTKSNAEKSSTAEI
jgi:hypothetical protein